MTKSLTLSLLAGSFVGLLGVSAGGRAVAGGAAPTPVAAAVAAPAVTASVPAAAAPAPASNESVLFEAVVSREDRVVSRVNALARVGADARIGFQAGLSPEPRLSLKYRVDEGPDGRLHAAIVALVNNQSVATEALAMTRDQGADATLAGGGFTFRVRADALTPELIARLRALKAKPRAN